MSTIDFIFSLLILLMSVVIHEVSHGYAARMLGDKTAEYEGRLTLNPLPHLDPIGSIFLPLVLLLSGTGILVGWAKPVPYNPYNLRNRRWGELWVAMAGPLSNLVLAFAFGSIIRFSPFLGISSISFLTLCSTIVATNISLAIFNLVPIPPLDGSKIVFALFPNISYQTRAFLDRYGLFLSLFFALFLWQYLVPIVYFLFTLFTGLHG